MSDTPIYAVMTAGLKGTSNMGSGNKTQPTQEVFECMECGTEVDKSGAAYPESGYCDMCRYAGDRDLV